MSGLPERLEAAVDAMEGCSWLSPGAAAFILDRLKEAWPAILSELSAQQPEAPAAGKLPAGWEAVEATIRDQAEEAITRLNDWIGDHLTEYHEAHLDEYERRVAAIFSAALKPLWPAPPPPAAWEAIERAVRDAIEAAACNCPSEGRRPHSIHCFVLQETQPQAGGPPRTIDRQVTAVLSALRSVELASAARAAKIEAALRDLLSDWEIETPKRARRIVAEHLEEDPQWETIRDTEVQSFRAAAAELRRATAPALDAPPPDPWAALMALLAELEGQAKNARDRADLVNVEPGYYDSAGYVAGVNASADRAADLASRLREALGLERDGGEHD